MLRLAADENFNADVVRGLRRRFPDLDLVRIQDVGFVRRTDLLPTLSEPTGLRLEQRPHQVGTECRATIRG